MPASARVASDFTFAAFGGYKNSAACNAASCATGLPLSASIAPCFTGGNLEIRSFISFTDSSNVTESAGSFSAETFSKILSFPSISCNCSKGFANT